MVKKEISEAERFERVTAIQSWEKTKKYIAKKARKGYKSDPNASTSQEIFDDLAKYEEEWNQTQKDCKNGKISGPEKHTIVNKLYKKIELLKKAQKNLRL